MQAAPALGLRATPSFDPLHDAIDIELSAGSTVQSRLFAAIPERQNSRVEFDGRPLTGPDLEFLKTTFRPDAQLMLLDSAAQKERLLEATVGA